MSVVHFVLVYRSLLDLGPNHVVGLIKVFLWAAEQSLTYSGCACTEMHLENEVSHASKLLASLGKIS